MNFLKQLSFLKFLASGEEVMSPLYNGLSLVGPYALTVVTALSIFWGIFLGVKYAQAEDEATKTAAQKTLINFLIGAGTIIVLLGVIYAIREPLCDWINS